MLLYVCCGVKCHYVLNFIPWYYTNCVTCTIFGSQMSKNPQPIGALRPKKRSPSQTTKPVRKSEISSSDKTMPAFDSLDRFPPLPSKMYMIYFMWLIRQYLYLFYILYLGCIQVQALCNNPRPLQVLCNNPRPLQALCNNPRPLQALCNNPRPLQVLCNSPHLPGDVQKYSCRFCEFEFILY